MRQDNELTRLLEDRYKKVYDPRCDEMVSKEEMERRTKELEQITPITYHQAIGRALRERDLARAKLGVKQYYSTLNPQYDAFFKRFKS